MKMGVCNEIQQLSFPSWFPFACINSGCDLFKPSQLLGGWARCSAPREESVCKSQRKHHCGCLQAKRTVAVCLGASNFEVYLGVPILRVPFLGMVEGSQHGNNPLCFHKCSATACHSSRSRTASFMSSRVHFGKFTLG